MTLLGRPGYRSQCLRYLFPIAPLAREVQISLPFAHSWWPDFYKSTRSFGFAFRNGLVPYAMYCDCWQSVLSDMIGPYRQRRSRLVTFVDPERLDASWSHLTCARIWSGQDNVCGFNKPWELGQAFSLRVGSNVSWRSWISCFRQSRQSEVNFVPSDLFVGHGFSLESMHLVADLNKPTMKLDISLEGHQQS